MARLNINVASNPFQNFLLLYLSVGVFVAMVFIFTAYNGFVLTRSLLESRRMKAEIQKNEEEIKKADIALQGRQILLAQAKEKKILELNTFIDELLSQRSFSWTLFFNEIERVIPEDVKITTIAPTFQGKQLSVRVECVAKGVNGMLAFTNNLSQSAAFKEPYIFGEDPQQDGGLRFVLNFEYDPAKATALREEQPEKAQDSAAGVGPPPAGG